ncbi:hypothetical protein KEM56_004854 [Ascosphaera pollenicola]|nr:hypothetical protein KEM56_004854 [Ascosphaera pollenicola]
MGSEPLLAIEAARKMRDTLSKLTCLRELTAAYGKGLINLGDAGEMVAALILLYSIDTTQDLLPEAIKVSHFLEVLLGSKVARDIEGRINRNAHLTSLWRDGNVYFSHFYRPPTAAAEASFKNAARALFGAEPPPYIGVYMSLRHGTKRPAAVEVVEPVMSARRESRIKSLTIVTLGLSEEAFPNLCLGSFDEELTQSFWETLAQIRDGQAQTAFPRHPNVGYTPMSDI